MGASGDWEFPAELLDRWADSAGEDAVREWAIDAKRRAAWCAETWRLSIDGFIPGGSLSCVLEGRRERGEDVVLKLLAPWAVDAIASEALALSAWRGCGVVDLLERSPDGRALLLRRVHPGSSFAASGNDRRDSERVARLLSDLAGAPVVDRLPALSASLRARFGRARVAARRRGASVSARELEQAEQCAIQLAESWTPETPVHGDLVNKNLLLDGDAEALVAIDPEPAVGDRHFDPALWALTHRPGKGVRERCAILADLLGLEAERLWSWCLALVVAEVALDVADRASAHRELAARFVGRAG